MCILQAPALPPGAQRPWPDGSAAPLALPMAAPQHQAGMASRVDGQRLLALLDENAVLTRELADAQQRSQRQAAQQARQIERQQADLLRLRAELIGRDTVIAALREDLQALESTVPDLRSREALSRECASLLTRVHALQRQLLQTQQAAERQLRRAEAPCEAREPGG